MVKEVNNVSYDLKKKREKREGLRMSLMKDSSWAFIKNIDWGIVKSFTIDM